MSMTVLGMVAYLAWRRQWIGANAFIAIALAVSLPLAGTMTPLLDDEGLPEAPLSEASEGNALPGMTDVPLEQIVTLPTGDTVIVEIHEDGRMDAVVDFAPRENGQQPGYVMMDDGSDYYVIPDDAGVEQGIADREDFNIVRLLDTEVRAPANGVTPQSSQGAEQDAEHTLTVIGHHRNGDPFDGNYVNFYVMNMKDRSLFVDSRPTFENGVYEATVPAGVYAVVGVDRRTSEDYMAFLGDPAIEVYSDTTVVLDAREATELTLDVETHDVWGREIQLGYMLLPENGNTYKLSSSMWYYDNTMYVGGTIDPMDVVEVGEFRFNVEWTMDAPKRLVGGWVDEDAPAVDHTPVTYYLPFTLKGQVPKDLNFTVDEEFLAERIANKPVRIHSNNENEYYREARHHWFYHPSIEGSFARLNWVDTPTERIEYVTAGEITQQQVYGDPDFQSVMREPATAWTPGEHDAKKWFAEPLRPGVQKQPDEVLRNADAPTPVTRDGDLLDMGMVEVLDATRQRGYADSTTSQLLNSLPPIQSGAWPGLTTNFRLLIEGTESPQTVLEARPRGSYVLDPSPATYQLVVESEMSGPRDWAARGSSTTTTWTFQSETTQSSTVLPIIEIDYDLPLSLGNEVSADGFDVGVELRPQPGGPDMAFSDVQVEYSYDDGTSWSATTVTGSNGSFTASIPPGDADAFSLRVSATDTISASHVEQELVRVAWIG